MPPPATSTHPPRHLVVRLRNWVGDVVLGVPALRLLADHGHVLHLVGKGWAGPLLSGEGWTFEPLGANLQERTSQLRRIRQDCLKAEPTFNRRLNAITLPFSFSSALDMRLAGLRAAGYAHEGRSLLLSRAVQRRIEGHESLSYWRLACSFLGIEAPFPASIDLKISPAHAAEAAALKAQRGVQAPYVMLAPFAGGTAEKLPKVWGHFPALATALRDRGHQLLVVAGPGEEEFANAHFAANSTVITSTHLGVYAALLKGAQLVIANDTGPGHLAAAVGARTLSILGPTNAPRWKPWGQQVSVVQAPGRQWADLAAVTAQAVQLLDVSPAMTVHG
ncbi:MAG TPA: glycosyltransferase family 9 protein [Rubrivivax sp.]|nr:glycosyltransferase family 9 protein [Rubrivivax sp.]